MVGDIYELGGWKEGLALKWTSVRSDFYFIGA